MEKKENLLCVSLKYSFYLITKRDTKGSRYQSYYSCNLDCAGRKYKPFHTCYTCGFARTQRTLNRKTESSCGVLLFMKYAVRGALSTSLLAYAKLLSEHLFCKLWSCFSCWALELPALMDPDKLPRVLAQCSIYEAGPWLIQPYWYQVYTQTKHCVGML